jgi:hypothetical protein
VTFFQGGRPAPPPHGRLGKLLAIPVLAALLACGGNAGSGSFFQAPAGYSVAVTPGSLAMPAGSAAQVTVTLTRINGFADPVTLSLANPPSGITWSGQPIAAGAGAGTFTIQVDGSMAPQTLANLEVVATDGSLSHQAAFSLTIQPPLPAGGVGVNIVAAGGGQQQGGPWSNTVITQEPVKAGIAATADGSLQIRSGFYPDGSDY